MTAPGMFLGVRIVEHPLALQSHQRFTVERIPRRRRRAYFVRKHVWTSPGCYQLADGTLVIHPQLAAALRAAP